MKKIFFVFILFLPFLVRAEIQTVSSVEEFQSVILASLENRNPVKTLTILPLSEVILIPENSMFRADSKGFDQVVLQINKKLKLSKQSYISEVILTEYKQKLADPKIIGFFQELQKYNAPFMVVTPNLSGSFNDIPYLEAWTWSYLLEQGIDLSKSPLGDKQIIFNKGRKKVKETYPTFYRGLFSCNSVDEANSSQSLIATLLVENLKWLPDVVYVIDTDEDYIKSIEQQFHSLRQDVQVFGFIYKPDLGESGEKFSTKELLNFWNKVIDKVNIVKRKEIDPSEENPYEQ
jgi:hypothetical protein